MASVGIIGASGYTGAELLRLLHGHPGLDLAWATGDSQAGVRAADLYPSLAVAYPDLVFTTFDPAAADGLDLVFLCLPHGKSQELMPDLMKRVPHIVDLGADFRLNDAATYEQWYHEPHQHPELLKRFVYGLPELFRAKLKKAALIAAPGCYPTCAALGLAPLVKHGVIESSGIIVDAASGVSGAGRALKHTSLYGTVAENYEAYGLLNHRHTAEIEMLTGAQVLFTPHLAPMTRGMLTTSYARPVGPTSTEALLALLRGVYATEPFVVVIDGSPSTKAVMGTNVCQITARFDERTGYVMVLAAIDNLTKGASGAMIQCANLALGIEETTGLSTIGLYP
jgi:N-acetyl-gamma-glutamyl-phosphate reductase